jgi:adenosine deaminase
VELHVHLEGAIRPETLVELARRNSVQLPVVDARELSAWLVSVGRSNFFGVLSLMARCLGGGDDFERAAYELGGDLARQNVRYAEVHYNVAFHHLRGVGFDESFGGLLRGSHKARRDFGVDMAWILVVMRAPRLDKVVREHSAGYSVSAAIEGMAQGVVAVGLGGEETDGDVVGFAGFFQRARAAGLHVVPHAGELAGPGNVADALDLLGAERIAHGVRAIERADLVQRLAASRICLDLCPTSNVRLGVYPDLATHPLVGLRAAGIPVSVSSDDPTAFGIDLNGEICAVANVVGLEDAEDILVAGIRYAFLSPHRRQALEVQFVAESVRLRAVHGLPARERPL